MNTRDCENDRWSAADKTGVGCVDEARRRRKKRPTTEYCFMGDTTRDVEADTVDTGQTREGKAGVDELARLFRPESVL